VITAASRCGPEPRPLPRAVDEQARFGDYRAGTDVYARAGVTRPQGHDRGSIVAGSILGNRVLRKEDPKFLTTGGVYLDDLRDEPLLEGAAYVAYVRSTAAHGTITRSTPTRPATMPGVLGVFTAEILGLEPARVQPDGGAHPARQRQGPLRRRAGGGRGGRPTYEQAVDAAQTVFVDIEPLEALVDIEAMRSPARR
jgi:aerobic carbon-monoxide dehydrogenase large subunit